MAIATSTALLDLRSLEVFVAVCRHMNMSAAARELDMTPSAVSHQISRLERDLNVELIHRRTRPHVITQAGELLREHAGQIVRRTLELPKLIEEKGRDRSRIVRLGLIGSLGSEFVPTLIRQLESRVEHLTVRSELAPDLRTALMARRYDYIISNDLMDDLDGVDVFRLTSEPYVLALPVGTPSIQTPAELAALSEKLPMIRWRQNSQMGQHIERHLRRNRLRIAHRFEFDGRDTINELVASGVGWTITSPLCLYEAFQRGLKLQVQLLPTPLTLRHIALAFQTNSAGAISQWLFEQSTEILRTRHLRALRQWMPDISKLIEVAHSGPERLERL